MIHIPATQTLLETIFSAVYYAHDDAGHRYFIEPKTVQSRNYHEDGEPFIGVVIETTVFWAKVPFYGAETLPGLDMPFGIAHNIKRLATKVAHEEA